MTGSKIVTSYALELKKYSAKSLTGENLPKDIGGFDNFIIFFLC